MAEVEFYGEKFEMAGEFSEFALMEFAEASEASGDADGTMHSMASMLRLVLDCIVPDDQTRFRDVARKNRAKAEKLMEVLQKAMAGAAERPTGQVSDSSAGPAPIVPKSESNFDDKVIEMFAGRPDLAMGLIDMNESRTG